MAANLKIYNFFSWTEKPIESILVWQSGEWYRAILILLYMNILVETLSIHTDYNMNATKRLFRWSYFTSNCVVYIPLDTWRLYTSMQRHDVASTLLWRCINVVCHWNASYDFGRIHISVLTVPTDTYFVRMDPSEARNSEKSYVLLSLFMSSTKIYHAAHAV